MTYPALYYRKSIRHEVIACFEIDWRGVAIEFGAKEKAHLPTIGHDQPFRSNLVSLLSRAVNNCALTSANSLEASTTMQRSGSAAATSR